MVASSMVGLENGRKGRLMVESGQTRFKGRALPQRAAQWPARRARGNPVL
jgi:hypothetical protein